MNVRGQQSRWKHSTVSVARSSRRGADLDDVVGEWPRELQVERYDASRMQLRQLVAVDGLGPYGPLELLLAAALPFEALLSCSFISFS